jgi:hypothetical protein
VRLALVVLVVACHPAQPPGLPEGVIYESSVSGGMPGSGSSSIIVHADGTTECTSVGPNQPTPVLVKGRIAPAQLESARQQLVACDVCDTKEDDHSNIPDAPSMHLSIDMRGASCGIDTLRRGWGDRQRACRQVIGALETAACTPSP